jgi:ketosteroid isomerase-like protein
MLPPHPEGNCMKLIVLTAVVVGFAARLLVPSANSIGATSNESRTLAITAVLKEQQASWNRGDVDAFMTGYWDSADVTSAGSSGITRGWQPLLDRYRNTYPDRKAMGHLDFSQLEVHSMGPDAAFVLGRWHLQRDADELGGVFTLIFQRFPEGWKIVHDHTSADAKKPAST